MTLFEVPLPGPESWRPRVGMAEMLPDDIAYLRRHPQRAVHARCVAWSVEQALGDRVAWHEILGDVTFSFVDEKGKVQWKLAPTLAAFKAAHGNRKGKRGGPREGGVRGVRRVGRVDDRQRPGDAPMGRPAADVAGGVAGRGAGGRRPAGPR